MHTPNFATATKSHHSDHQSPADQYCRLGYGSLVVSILDEARIHHPSRLNEIHCVIEAKTHKHTPPYKHGATPISHHSDHQSPADHCCRLGYGSLVVSILDEARIHHPSRPNEIQGVIEAKTHMHTPPYPNIPPFRSPEPSRPLLSPWMWFTGRIYPR